MTTTDLVVPKLGESITEAVIAKWLKQVGEPIQADEPVVDLETDKVSVALPAPAAGVLAEQKFAAGTTVKIGDVIGTIAPGPEIEIREIPKAAQTPPPAPAPVEKPVPAQTQSPKVLPTPAPTPTKAPPEIPHSKTLPPS